MKCPFWEQRYDTLCVRRAIAEGFLFLNYVAVSLALSSFDGESCSHLNHSQRNITKSVHVLPSSRLPETWPHENCNNNNMQTEPYAVIGIPTFPHTIIFYFIFSKLWLLSSACCFPIRLVEFSSSGYFFYVDSFVCIRYSDSIMVKLKFKSTCKSFKNKYFMRLCETIWIGQTANIRFWHRFWFQ